MAITFAVEAFDKVIGEIKPLLERHWTTLTIHGLCLDPNYPAYKVASEAGYLVIYSAREAVGTLAGYALYFTAKNPHHRTLGWASSDVIWLDVPARRPRVADRLIGFVEADLARRGVDVMQTGVRPSSPALGRLLEKRGHEITAITYSKRLR